MNQSVLLRPAGDISLGDLAHAVVEDLPKSSVWFSTETTNGVLAESTQEGESGQEQWGYSPWSRLLWTREQVQTEAIPLAALVTPVQEVISSSAGDEQILRAACSVQLEIAGKLVAKNNLRLAAGVLDQTREVLSKLKLTSIESVVVTRLLDLHHQEIERLGEKREFKAQVASLKSKLPPLEARRAELERLCRAHPVASQRNESAKPPKSPSPQKSTAAPAQPDVPAVRAEDNGHVTSLHSFGGAQAEESGVARSAEPMGGLFSTFALDGPSSGPTVVSDEPPWTLAGPASETRTGPVTLTSVAADSATLPPKKRPREKQSPLFWIIFIPLAIFLISDGARKLISARMGNRGPVIALRLDRFPEPALLPPRIGPFREPAIEPAEHTLAALDAVNDRLRNIARSNQRDSRAADSDASQEGDSPPASPPAESQGDRAIGEERTLEGRGAASTGQAPGPSSPSPADVQTASISNSGRKADPPQPTLPGLTPGTASANAGVSAVGRRVDDSSQVKGADGRIYGPAPSGRAAGKPDGRGLNGEPVQAFVVEEFQRPIRARVVRKTNVLSRPSVFAALVMQLDANATVLVSSRMGGWLELSPLEGRRGYIFAQDAELAAP